MSMEGIPGANVRIRKCTLLSHWELYDPRAAGDLECRRRIVSNEPKNGLQFIAYGLSAWSLTSHYDT